VAQITTHVCANVVNRTILSLAVYQLLASNRTGILVVYFPLFLVVSRGAPVAVALLFTSVAWLGSSLIGPIAGRLSDRVGRRKPFLVAGELGALPCYLAVPFLPGYLEAGLAFILGTVILGLGSPALNAFISDVSRLKERGGSYGFLNAASGAGAIFGFLAVGALVSTLGLDYLFYFAAAVMACVATYVIVAVTETPHVAPPIASSPLRLGPLLAFSTAVSIRTLAVGAVGSFVAIWAVTLGGNAFDVSLIAVAGLLVVSVGGAASGQFVDRRGEWSGLLAGTLAQTASWIVFLVATTWLLLPGAQALNQIGYVLVSPAMLVWVSRVAPPDRCAEYQGIYALINSGLWSLGPSAGAWAFTVGGGHAVFLFSILITLASFAAIGVFQIRYRGRTEAASTRQKTASSSG
jgi:MFS family permease